MNLRSLKYSLVLPYVLMIVILALALGGSSYFIAAKNISVFSNQYMREITARIAQAVNFHIGGSGPVLEAAFPEGTYAAPDLSQDINDLRMRFWIATSMFTNPNNYVYYGNKHSQSIALKRLSDTEVELRLKINPDENRIYYRHHGILDTPIQYAIEENLFDPRTRLWFINAKNNNAHIWTTVYIDFSSQELVVTRAKKVIAENGDFQGVVATDVSLKEIDKFIKSLDVGQQGRAFLVEADGHLLAASSVPNIKLVENKYTRVTALDNSDQVIALAYSGIAKLIDADELSKTYHTEYNTIIKEQGQTISVSARKIVDDAGLNWLAIVAIPQQQIFSGVHKQIWLGLFFGLIAVALTILIGLRIFSRIANDVISLLKAVNRVRSGDLEVDITVNRRDEIGDLALNFKAMHKEIFTDRLTGLLNRTALENILKTYTKESDKQPFTLLFLDLNKFKSLNDNYGHNNGDLALIEIAQRLKNMLRADDFLIRLGGDEFIVISNNIISGKKLAVLKDKIKATIQTPLKTLQDLPSNTEICLDIAIGVAYWPLDTTDPDKLIKIADKQMYANKPVYER